MIYLVHLLWTNTCRRMRRVGRRRRLGRPRRRQLRQWRPLRLGLQLQRSTRCFVCSVLRVFVCTTLAIIHDDIEATKDEESTHSLWSSARRGPRRWRAAMEGARAAEREAQRPSPQSKKRPRAVLATPSRGTLHLVYSHTLFRPLHPHTALPRAPFRLMR